MVTEKAAAEVPLLVKSLRERDEPPLLVEIPDRRKALYYALDHAQPGDMIAVIGKGHETTQQFAGESIAFDDCKHADKALRDRAQTIAENR